jgi:type IV pilus assembly protein PilY1
MKSHIALNRIGRTLLALSVGLLAPGWGGSGLALANATDIAPAPVFTTTTATTEVKPNVLFVLDDSGSMDWDFMPDDAGNFTGRYGYNSNQCNGVYYNPSIAYTAPVDAAGVSFPDATFSAAWNDGYPAKLAYDNSIAGGGTVSAATTAANNTGTTNLGTSLAYFYVYTGTQTTEKLKDYYTTSSTFYKECNSAIGSAVTAAAPGSGVFSKRRLATTETTTITVSGNNSTSVSGITVNNVQLMSGTAAASTSSSTLAASIRALITLNGFSATVSGSVITITGPAAAANYTPVVTKGNAGTMTFTADVFPDTTAANLTNFANWYSYYRTRMQMMKTAAGQAFKPLTSHFRVGFMTINNNASPAFLNIADFASTQKTNWYQKLYASSPGSSTPLREALASAGRIYAGQITSQNGATVTDPVQFSCQQNYTILSTDGFWNGTDANVHKLNGTTTMDNQDGTLARPYNDGATATSTIVTPYVSTQDRQTVTSGASTTKTWTRYTTVIGASCSIPGGSAPPPNTTSAFMLDNSNHKIALGLSSSNPDSSRCYKVGSANAWFCRGSGTNNPAGSISSSTVTDSSGVTWYLVSSGAGASGCVSDDTAFGSGNGYSSSMGACPATTTAAVTGKLVTTTPSTQTESISGSTTTIRDRYTATQTTTQTITNGVAGLVGAMTPATPAFAFASNVSNVTTPASSDVCSGQDGTVTPCPNAGGTWTAGTANPNGVCTATASLPAAGTTAPVVTGTTSTGGTTPAYTVVASTAATAGTPTVTQSSTGGTSNTLADVAAYYYNTNLRTSALGNCTGPIVAPATTNSDLCQPNKVPSNGLDTATWQHMTTFTLGLGARGRMVFSSTYLTDSSGDYFYVARQTTASATTCTWRDTLTVTGQPCNWPLPGADKPENIDDLWHAAVNGHGNYFSATDPATLASALASSLNVIINTPQPGTAASAATTNPKITASSNFQFSSYFKSVEWSGELIRQTISLIDGSVPPYDHMHPDPTKYDWSAQLLLDAKAYTSRTIYTKGLRANGTTGLIPFTWADLTTAGLQAYFDTPDISSAASVPSFPTVLTKLNQFCTPGPTDCISSTAQTNNTIATGGAAGEALVNFLRGDRSNEEGTVTDATKFFRNRAHVLGDIVSAQPQYIGPPNKLYADANYSTPAAPATTSFTDLKATRTAVVYAAANDGMLHAFDVATGNEKWAYIPTFVLPKLYTLADKKYSDKHQYFVEGTPIWGDICPNAPATVCSPSQWKTIIVGGLNGGGTGYYALDVTDPEHPAVLWEFTDPNMGYTFGKPQITKLDDGTWVVLLTSGYNNCPRAATTAQQNCVKNATGDGQGRLYVLNASTGAAVGTNPLSIATGIGSASVPSGLAQIIAHAGSDNVTTNVYGGDLLGDLWRFTITGAGYSKQLLATFKDNATTPNAQPITARPQVTTYNTKAIVYVGTGRYLGTTDVGNPLQQSFYAVKDNVVQGAAGYGSPRTDSTFISKTAVDGICPTGTDIAICQPGTKIRTVVQNGGTSADSIATKNGWFVDFPAGAGELEFTDPKLVHGTLAFSTSVPTATTSEVCGSSTGADPVSLFYMLDYLNGGPVGTTSGVIARTGGAGIATTPQFGMLPDGTVIAKYRLSSGQEVIDIVRFGGGANSTKRVSWRELVSE